ncbi:MAG TPA: hypothetical protein VGP47_11035, partial [Parachlamydiaceae bacterium]|nr:hypothetical protein [Parachlamydiaceae bacterium]
MIPGKDANFKPAHTLSKNEVFQTPWKSDFFGTREKLVMIRDRVSGSVTAQIVSQNVFKRFLPQDKKFTIEIEKKFTDISEDRFKREKQELQKLLAKHASVNDMLAQIEKDLKILEAPNSPPSSQKSNEQNEPQNAQEEAPVIPISEDSESEKSEMHNSSSTSEEIEMEIPILTSNKEVKIPTLSPLEFEIRQTTVQALRDELEVLMNKIRKQEIKPEFKSFERLKKSIDHIKETVYSTFSQLNQLNIDAENPALSLTELQNSADELRAVHSGWKNRLAAIKQTFVEGVSLKEEIDRISHLMHPFSSKVQSQWEELIEELDEQCVSQLTSSEEVYMLKQRLSRAVATISKLCKEESAKSMDTSLADLKEHLDATAPVLQENDKQQAHIDYRKLVLAERNNTWMSLKDAKNHLGNDFEKIAKWQHDVAKEQAIDEALA